MSSNRDSEDPNVVIIPVEDYLSDGSVARWPVNDGRFDYRMLDDTRWREALAEMWVQKTGAYEEGKISIILLNTFALLHFRALGVLAVGHDSLTEKANLDNTYMVLRSPLLAIDFVSSYKVLPTSSKSFPRATLSLTVPVVQTPTP